MNRHLITRCTRKTGSGERGFALLSVLWISVGVAGLVLTLVLIARQSFATTRNRAALERATWAAEECLAWGLAHADDAFQAESEALTNGDRPAANNPVDLLIGRPIAALDQCTAVLRPAGTTLDVNQATEEMIWIGLTNLGVAGGRADSLVAALLDWRDEDEIPHPAGAEGSSYPSGRTPRNGLLADVDELRRVRGWSEVPGLESVFGVEGVRITTRYAPPEVLAAVPGARRRESEAEPPTATEGRGLFGILALGGADPEPPRTGAAPSTTLSRWTTEGPDEWVLTSHGTSGEPVMRVGIELRLIWTGDRFAIVRRRMWLS